MRPSLSVYTHAVAIIAVLVASTFVVYASDASDASDAADAAGEKAAPSPAYRAAIKRFLLATNIPAQMGEQMTYSATEQALAAHASNGVTITEPMQAIAVEEARKDFGKRFGDVDYLTDLYSTIYADHFSEKEVTELAAFWESPVAKKLMTSTTAINEAFAAKLEEAVTPMSAALQTRLDKRLRDGGALSNTP